MVSDTALVGASTPSGSVSSAHLPAEELLPCVKSLEAESTVTSPGKNAIALGVIGLKLAIVTRRSGRDMAWRFSTEGMLVLDLVTGKPADLLGIGAVITPDDAVPAAACPFTSSNPLSLCLELEAKVSGSECALGDKPSDGGNRRREGGVSLVSSPSERDCLP